MKKKTAEALTDDVKGAESIPVVSDGVSPDEYEELTKEFPELKGKNFENLPQEVKQAVEKGEKLLTAYLYYRHEEAKRVSAANKAAALADEKSAGSMKSHLSDGSTEAGRRYLNALWGR